MLYLWASGTMIFFLVVLIANLKIYLIGHTILYGQILITSLSIISYIITWGIQNEFMASEIANTMAS